jgi:hypothetical protein
MDWSRILAQAGIPEPPGYRETVEAMRAPGYESGPARWRREQEEAAAARAVASKEAKKVSQPATTRGRRRR